MKIQGYPLYTYSMINKGCPLYTYSMILDEDFAKICLDKGVLAITNCQVKYLLIWPKDV